MIDFNKILYTPLDIPLLPFSKKNSIISKYKEFSVEINKSTDKSIPVFWNGITCYKGESFEESRLLYKGVFLDLNNELKEEIDILKYHLPIEIESISLWTNIIHVPAHVDATIYDSDLDFRFRFFIIQERKSFFIDYEGKQRYISLPEDTNTFCFNNKTCKHGATFDPLNSKILGVLRGKIVDKEKLSILLEKSINRHKTYCFTKNNFL